jgi:hypothetical protein
MIIWLSPYCGRSQVKMPEKLSTVGALPIVASSGESLFHGDLRGCSSEFYVHADQQLLLAAKTTRAGRIARPDLFILVYKNSRVGQRPTRLF